MNADKTFLKKQQQKGKGKICVCLSNLRLNFCIYNRYIMHVLVTGGAGYIGSVVSAQLIAAGHHVTVLDDLSNGHRAAVPVEATFVRADVGDRKAVEACLAQGKFNAVMHFAAFIEAGESMEQPEKYFRNNTAHTVSLLDLLLARGITRFVFSSTAAVYGAPERVPITEETPMKPVNVYGESKKRVEETLARLHTTRGLRYASLRYFNVAGADGPRGEAHKNETHLIPLILQVAQGRRASIQIHGTDYETPDGTCVRDYIHVSDLAAAHLLALDALMAKESGGPMIYNLGNGKGFSVKEVIAAARKVTGHAIPVVEGPRRAGDPAVLVASSEKIARELGWKARHASLEEIVQSAWEWEISPQSSVFGHR